MEWVTQVDQRCPRFENAKAVDSVSHSVRVMDLFSRNLAVCTRTCLQDTVICICYVVSNQGSNSPNPITCINSPVAKSPCRPWLRGDHLDPNGNVCKICYSVFKHGAYKKKYKTFKRLRLVCALSIVRLHASV